METSNDLAILLLTREVARQCPSLMDRVRAKNSTKIIFMGTLQEHAAILKGLLDQASRYGNEGTPFRAAADYLLAHAKCLKA